MFQFRIPDVSINLSDLELLPWSCAHNVDIKKENAANICWSAKKKVLCSGSHQPLIVPILSHRIIRKCLGDSPPFPHFLCREAWDQQLSPFVNFCPLHDHLFWFIRIYFLKLKKNHGIMIQCRDSCSPGKLSLETPCSQVDSPELFRALECWVSATEFCYRNFLLAVEAAQGD